MVNDTAQQILHYILSGNMGGKDISLLLPRTKLEPMDQSFNGPN